MAEAPSPGQGSLVGVWKRDDGLYLRVREEGGRVHGVLSDAEGLVHCRVRFQEEGGVWIGLANWERFESRWELSRGSAGLSGRSQWVDLLGDQVVASGWSPRSFVQLPRVN